MSIKQQIEKLMKLQEQSESWERVSANLGEWFEKQYDQPLEPSILAEIRTFCKSKIVELDTFAAFPTPKPVKTPPAPEREKALDNVDLIFEEEKPKIDPQVLKDPLKFITKYKNWVGKKVLALDGQGNKVYAEVIGAAFPNLLIKTQSGTKVPASPETLELTDTE